jgi:sugar lactone lactonase YvrE
MHTRKGLMAVLLAAVVAVVGSVTSDAKRGDRDRDGGDRHGQDKTRVYTLPANAGNPEGIAFDRRTGAFYVSEARPGSDGQAGRVWRGTLDDPTLEAFLPSDPGRQASIGLKVRRDRLYIAGGQGGNVDVHDLETKELVARFQLCSGCFVNDLAVARNGDVFATESLQTPQVIYRIPASSVEAGGGPVDPITVTPPVTPAPGFNDNGIALTRNDRFAIFVQSNTGKLFRLNTRTRRTREIAVRGDSLENGDGLVLKGRTLYVVRNQNDLIAKAKLNGRLTRARVVKRITNPTFEDPTTAALAGGRLLVVNSEFFETPPTPPYTVSSIKAR